MAPSGDLFEDAPGPSTQGDQSPAKATPSTEPVAPRDEPSGSSFGSFESCPLEVWYRDDTRDSVDEDPQSWVDPEVRKMSSLLNRSSSLLGMAKAICQHGPWFVRVSPCRSRESISTAVPVKGKPCFYLYDTLHSKLGIKLPFTHFERKADKVGWTSLCSRPKRKLFEPFLASYKEFKSRFFKVTPGDSGPNLLVDRASRPFFPLTWMHQPAVSITVNLKDLEDWEDKFARELSELPLFPSAKIIKGVDYSSRALRELKRKAVLMAEEEEQPVAASAEPIAEVSDTPSLVILNEPAPPSPVVEKTDDVSSLRSEERPSKRQHTEKLITEDAEVKKGPCPSNHFQRDTLLSGHTPSSSVRGPPPFLGQAVDKGLASSSESNKVKQLGVTGTYKTLQQYAVYSLILAKAAEKKFGRLEFQSRSYAERVEKTEADFLKLFKAYAEVEIKLNSYRSANAALEEDLQRTIAKNKDLAGKNFDLDKAVDYANAEASILKKKNEDLEASKLDLHEKLASAESSRKQALEDIRFCDQIIQSRDQTILTSNQPIKAHERTVIKMDGDIVHHYEAGFAKALEQVRFLHPAVDVSEVDPFKEFVDGQLVLVPTPPSSPASQ
ncbi:hypothetical protein CR513_42368, partial [Mucuna pruriens]